MSFSNSQGATFNNGQFNNIAGDGMLFLSNSHGTTSYDGQLNNIAGNQCYNNNNSAGTQYNNNSTGNQYNNSTLTFASPAQTALQILWQAIADVEANHNSEGRYPQPRCHPETRTEVRRRFVDHVRLRERSWFVYWLYGPAGAGKSAVAQSISEECHISGDLVSSFFCSRNHPKRNNPAYLFLTIAYGLACTIPELQEPIGHAIHRNPAVLRSSIEEQFLELVAKPCRWLTRRGWGNRPRLVIIDGLDECEGGHTQTRILGIIASSVRESEGLPLQFLICSRPEPDIREFFDTKVFHPLIWYYLLDNDESSYHDIFLFLQDGLAKIRADVKYHSIRFPAVWPDPEDVHAIVRKACGQFVYVATLLRWIAEGFFSPCRMLEIVLGLVPNIDGDSPFKDLDVLYLHILSAYPEQQQKTVMKILALILHANEFLECKLSLADIEKLLSLPEGEATLALRGLHSVLEITDTTVTVRHASFTDFLTHSSRSRAFFLDPAYYGPFCASRVIRHLNRLLGDQRFLDWRLEDDSALPRVDCSVWFYWHKSCTATEHPTEELLSELRTFDLDRPLHLIDNTLQTLGEAWATWWEFVLRAENIIHWLESLPVENQDLVCRFRSVSAGFHLSVPGEDTALVLDAAFGLLAAGWIEQDGRYSVSPKCLRDHSQDRLKEYDFEARVRVLHVNECSNCKQFAAHDLPTSEVSLTPIECSPGVIFVRPLHIVFHFVTVIGHKNPELSAAAIEILLDPDSIETEQDISLLRQFARQPPPALLLLFEPAVPSILNYIGSFHLEYVLLEFVEWLKSLLPDPGYHAKVVPLMQQVRDWTICIKLHYRYDYQLECYLNICKILDEAGFGGVDVRRRHSIRQINRRL
ncbi:hypothetical protein V5O48_013169 [Marasmius crinis-equi]|uniref:Nephrocystin 3-like N-terminal domain-containing protein n=1 Tax=Marasmius crinis-equi TaxID=585013 RepID=A0ABR3F185_9AGAR